MTIYTIPLFGAFIFRNCTKKSSVFHCTDGVDRRHMSPHLYNVLPPLDEKLQSRPVSNLHSGASAVRMLPVTVSLLYRRIWLHTVAIRTDQWLRAKLFHSRPCPENRTVPRYLFHHLQRHSSHFFRRSRQSPGDEETMRDPVQCSAAGRSAAAVTIATDG